jgi:hypothetical protein
MLATQGSVGMRITVQGQPQAKTQDPIQTTTKSKKGAWGMAQVVQIPIPPKQKKEET